MYLVVPVRSFVFVSVCLSKFSCLNRLTFDLDFMRKTHTVNVV